MRISKSRNVSGYVKAEVKRRKLLDRLARKLTDLEPLQRAVHEAGEDCKVRRLRLTGGQMAEAERILNGSPEPARHRPLTTKGVIVTPG